MENYGPRKHGSERYKGRIAVDQTKPFDAPIGEWYPWLGVHRLCLDAQRYNYPDGTWAWGFVTAADFFDIDAENPKATARALHRLDAISKGEVKARGWVSDMHYQDPNRDRDAPQWIIHRERSFKTAEEALEDLQRVRTIFTRLSSSVVRRLARRVGKGWHVPGAGDIRLERERQRMGR